MNRYMSYQYSNNNFAYTSPTTTSVPYTSYSSTRPTINKAHNDSSSLSNRYPNISSPTTRYKTSELPWSSSLASSSRYPINSNQGVTSSASFNNRSNPTRTISYKSPSSIINMSDPYFHTAASSYSSKPRNEPVMSTTISGRSLFDYSAPRSTVHHGMMTRNTGSRIYDGQLRRTVTARYHRVLPPNNEETNRHSPKQSSTNESQPMDPENNPLTVNKRGQASSKPLRSTSLKLKASYTNILDQLATTTLSKLKLGSSNYSPNTNGNYKRTTAQNHSNKQPSMGVIPNGPEPDDCGIQCNGATGGKQYEYLDASDKALKTKTNSPGSTSSGLSSGPAGISPPLSSASSQPNRSPCMPGAESFPAGEKPVVKSSDSGNSNTDSANDDSDEDDESRTVVDAKTISLLYMDKRFELKSSADSVSESRDNLIKAGVILAELKKSDPDDVGSIQTDDYVADDDEDDSEDDGESDDSDQCDSSSLSHSIIRPQINESELILTRQEPDYKWQTSKLVNSASLGDVLKVPLVVKNEVNKSATAISIAGKPSSMRKSLMTKVEDDDPGIKKKLDDACKKIDVGNALSCSCTDADGDKVSFK